MPSTPLPAPAGLPAELADRAVAMAERWIAESDGVEVDRSAQRLAGVLKDPDGLPFTIGFVDGVMRPESLSAAASALHRIAPLVPEFLPWYLRGAVHAGGALAPVLPAPVVPIARRVLREMVGHLVVDARPEKLGPAIAGLREGGARLNLNLLGEAVLGEGEAERRLEGIHDLIRRPDVDYVSVKVSAVASHVSMWAFDEVVDGVVARLLPLYLTALGMPGASGESGAEETAAPDQTFINLDMEEYRDLDLTIAVFMRLLEDPRLQQLEAGIVLQAYLPDALGALEQLTTWARERVEAGGAPIKIRLVKGANLAMERVDAVMHGWPLATYDAKVDTDANYLRCLDAALRPESTAAVRIGVAGHNLFDIAYAWLLAGERGVRDRLEFEMLLGMAQGQVAAVAREVGHVLLYVPVVRPDEFDVAISYLVRRLEENASGENFLSAASDLATDRPTFERERDRFLASVRSGGRSESRLGAESHPGSVGGALRAGAACGLPQPPRGPARGGLRPHGGRPRHRAQRGGGRRVRVHRPARRRDGGRRPRSQWRHRADRTESRGPELRRSVLRRDGRLRTSRVGHARDGCAGLSQFARFRSGTAGQSGVGAQHPVSDRDLDRRRRDDPRRRDHRRGHPRSDDRTGAGCRRPVGREARGRSFGGAGRRRSRSWRRGAPSSSRSRPRRPARCSPKPTWR